MSTARVLVPLGTDNNDGNVGHGEVHFARKNYLERLFSEDLLPLLISPFTPLEDAYELLEESSGLFLMGGDDINASFYGEQNHEENKTVIAERDILELNLVRRALEKKIPVLGICRGAQVMAVACEGKLYQHLPDVSDNMVHAAPEGFSNYHNWISTVEHEISIDAGTYASHILSCSGDVSITINSAHHQAIKDPGALFRIVGRSRDGIPEVIEHIDSDYFCFGIQSHPEVEGRTALSPFFAEFASVCKKFKT